MARRSRQAIALHTRANVPTRNGDAMLRQLQLNHFAVVRAATLDLEPGMTAISGETGAGKSLLVDALLLLTGARAEAQMVRHGAQRAELEAEFWLADAASARTWLAANELDDGDDPDTCRLRRVIRSDGGSRAWINGRSASLAQLAELGELLVEIHGQHEHQALLSRSSQMGLLDAFGGHDDLLAATRSAAERCRQVAARIAQLGDADTVAQRMQELDRQLNRLERLELAPSAIEALLQAHRLQANAAQRLDGSNRVLAGLAGDEGQAVERTLARLRVELERLTEHDPAFAQALERIDAATIEVAEATALVERIRDGIDIDPERLQALDESIAQLHELGRRHRVPLEGLAGIRDELAREREGLRDADAQVQRLQAESAAARTAWHTAAAALSSARTATAARLGDAVSLLMGDLGMAGGRLQVELTPTRADVPSPAGSEQVEFLVAANPGQPPRPLRKVASGGELSRISLAIEVAALGMDAVPTMVFDEVDTGIGGAVAEVVGRKLRALGTARQALCVTHLPQVAAQAHHHVRVSKDHDATTTRSAVARLDQDERVAELARMLGGIEITPETLAHATRMLVSAQREA